MCRCGHNQAPAILVVRFTSMVEAQSMTRGIKNQRTMFDYVIASPSPEVATEICDLFLMPLGTTTTFP